jgi:DNA (cytosine-5)-methyltransferase 1
MFEYVRAVGELRPNWFIWENVPGCLNTRDNAFGQLLHEMENVGYKDIAWRVLDSQFTRVSMRDGDGRIVGWFGPVAQRRRRVFLVGHLGDGGGFASTAVLFEPESLRGNPTTSKQKREALARDAESGVGEAGTISFKWWQGANARSVAAYDDGTTSTLTNSDSHQAAVMIPAYAIRTSNTKANGCGIQSEVAHTIDAAGPEAIAFAQNQRDEVRLIGGKGDVASALTSTQFGTHKGETLICMSSGQANAEIEVDDVSPTLTNLHEQPIVCMADDAQNSAIDVDVSGTLKCGGGDTVHSYVSMTGDIVNALCAADGDHGVGNQYFMDGKVISQKG